jgi:hypothetical protein
LKKIFANYANRIPRKQACHAKICKGCLVRTTMSIKASTVKLLFICRITSDKGHDFLAVGFVGRLCLPELAYPTAVAHFTPTVSPPKLTSNDFGKTKPVFPH